MHMNTSSGAPGAAPQILIRGINSITASTAPLYVIDGVPVNSGSVAGSSNYTSLDLLSLLGNDNIENISVLKDASAVAPYGASGSNGVILITTKSGTTGKARYNVNLSTGVINDAVRGLRMANAEERAFAVREAAWNSYGANGASGTDFTNPAEAEQYAINNITGGAKMGAWIDAGRPNVDWRKLVRNKDALIKAIDFSVSQGGETSNFMAGVGYNSTEGTVIGSDFRRFSGHFKYNTDLNNFMNLNLSANVSNVDQNGVLEESAYFSNPNLAKYFMSPWAPAYDADGNIDYGPNFTSQSGGLHNVLLTANDNIANNNITRVLQNSALNVDITDDLKFKTVLGLDYTVANFKQWRTPLHGDGLSNKGTGYESTNRFYTYTTQNSLDYNLTLAEKHNFSVSAVQEFTKYKNNYLWASANNFPNEHLTNLSAASAGYDASSSFNDMMSMRYVGLVNYNFDQKYLVNMSFTRQGDSRFSAKWGNFYSVGLGWNVHEEDFLKDSDLLNELRLRASFGETGNAGIGRNAYQALIGFGDYRNNPATLITGYGTDATWERSQRMDLGVQFAMLNHRLNGSVGVYSNTTKDMLLNVSLPLSATFRGGSVLENVGEMENKGLEFELNGTIIQTEDFSWSAGLVYGQNTNKVTKLPEESEDKSNTKYLREGGEYYEWYVKEWAGVDPTNGDPLWYVNRNESDATTNVYADAEQVLQGKNALPKFSGSLNTRFDYKGFFLEGTLYFAGGHKIYEDWSNYVQSTSSSNVLAFNTSKAAVQGAWTSENTNATHPRFGVETVLDNATAASSRWLHNGDFMRLRDVGFGYTFKSETIKSVGLSGLTLAVRGTNLFTWKRSSTLEWDPEVRTNGYTNMTTPATKTLLFNVNLNF